MKWLLLLGVAIFLIVRARRRRGDPPAAGRFGVLAAFAVLAACIALLTAVLKVGWAFMAAGLAGLCMLSGVLALGLMKLRR